MVLAVIQTAILLFIFSLFGIHHESVSNSRFGIIREQTSSIPQTNIAQSKVLILQVDSRPLEHVDIDMFLKKGVQTYFDKGSKEDLPSMQTVAAAVNYMYSCRHGYDYRYIRFDKAEGCRSPTNNPRSATWCKIPGIAWALQDYETVLFLDTDTMVMRQHVTIEDWIKDNNDKTIADEGVNTPLEHADLIGSNDWNPFVIRDGTKINGGVLLFRKINKYQEILQGIWRHNGTHDRRYAHEQSVLSKEVFPKFREYIARVKPGSMNGVYGQWIRHFSARRTTMAKERFFAVAGTVVLQQAVNNVKYPCKMGLLDKVVQVDFNKLIPNLNL